MLQHAVTCAEFCSQRKLFPKVCSVQCAVCSTVCRVAQCAASAGYSLMFPISRIAPLCHSVNWTAHSALNFCSTFLSFLIVALSCFSLLSCFCLLFSDITDPVGDSCHRNFTLILGIWMLLICTRFTAKKVEVHRVCETRW